MERHGQVIHYSKQGQNHRVPGVIEWNMFDMEAKFADVLTVDEVVKYLESIDNSVYRKPERKLDKVLVTN